MSSHQHKASEEPDLVDTLPELDAPPLRPSQEPSIGALIAGTYRVIRTLGDGGMGVVLLARDERLDRDVAIKLVRSTMAQHREFRKRFLTEARAMAQVRHENVVTIYSYGEHEGAPYFVMEYVPGETVEDWLRVRQGPLPTDQVMGILEQMCRGIDAIHSSGTIHGDVKPSNVLIGPAFRVAVADLGLALPVHEIAGEPIPVAGTPAYMAPERAMQTVVPELAPRADVYSLGVVAFELLTGRLPFEGDNARRLIYLHLSEEPPLPSSIRPGLPSEIDDLILNALKKDPIERTASAEEFRQSLLAAQQNMTRPHGRVRVLVAEDDDDFRYLSARWLKQAFPSAEIVGVGDGAAALREIQRTPYALAVIDLHMPGLNGIELTAAIRAAENGRKVPILVVTGQGGAPDWQRLSELGADGFLVKPVDATSLIMTARRMVETAMAA